MRTILTPQLARVAADVEIPLVQVEITARIEQGTEQLHPGEIVATCKSLAEKWKGCGYAKDVE